MLPDLGFDQGTRMHGALVEADETGQRGALQQAPISLSIRRVLVTPVEQSANVNGMLQEGTPSVEGARPAMRRS